MALTLQFPGRDPSKPALPVEPYPSTETGWQARYDTLWMAYLLGAYSSAEAKAFHLFRALDDAGREIDATRRVYGAYRFIVDTDRRGFLGPGLTLESPETTGKAARLAKGEAVWRASDMDEWLSRDIGILAGLGDYWYEAVKFPDGHVELVGYDPRLVCACYDNATSRKLVSVTVEAPYYDEAQSGRGDDASVGHTWKRVITAEGVRETIDGRETIADAYSLGAVPMAHLRWSPWDQPEHSLPAPHGVDSAIMLIDSFLTQIGAIGNRYASPKLVMKGFKAGAGENTQRFGAQFLGIPADGDAKYLEYAATGIGPIREAIADIMAHVRETNPEFIFADNAAGESGSARSWKSAAFAMKIHEARRHNFAALAKVTGMAVARSESRPYDPERDVFRIDAPPPLAPNVQAEVDTLKAARDLGGVTQIDVIKHLQRLGIADPDADPVAYAQQVADETMGRAQGFMTGGVDPLMPAGKMLVDDMEPAGQMKP